jgi:hypothetical protein
MKSLSLCTKMELDSSERQVFHVSNVKSEISRIFLASEIMPH